MGLCFGHLLLLLEQLERRPHNLFLVFFAYMVPQYMEEIIQQPGFPAGDQFVGSQGLDQLAGRLHLFAGRQQRMGLGLPGQPDDPDEARRPSSRPFQPKHCP